MKISTKVSFGIAALIDIAIHSEGGETVTVYSISKRQNISGKYLEQILTVLRQASIIRGMKGSKGGYVVAKPTEEITFKDIINALDVTVLNDASLDETQNSSAIIKTVNQCIWEKMTEYLQSFAESITLADITKLCKNSIEEDTEPMYYI